MARARVSDKERVGTCRFGLPFDLLLLLLLLFLFLVSKKKEEMKDLLAR